jgi:hypothetical protein
VLSVPKRTPHLQLVSDEYSECIETTPRVFGPVKRVVDSERHAREGPAQHALLFATSMEREDTVRVRCRQGSQGSPARENLRTGF